MQRSLKALTKTLLVAIASIAFVACGGGSGGGGGGGGGGEFLQLASEPSYGIMGTTTTVQPFNLMAPSPVSLVGPNDFASAQAMEVNFIQLNFTTTVLASSVLGNTNGGDAGVVIRDSAGNLVPIFLDSTGAIDASNAFPSPGVAPATLRIYFEAAGMPGVPIALVPDKYSVSLLPTNLKSGSGQSYCAIKDSGLCLNRTNTVYHFTLDGMNTTAAMPAPLASGPTVALPLPAIAQIDDEIRLFFSDHVDFQSIVGFNTNTGMVNVTTQDPFVSLPFVMNAVGAMGANINVSFVQPAPAVLPANYGYIVYMPDPFKDPTEVRIRFVDTTNLSGIDDPTGATTGGTPTFQNYALPSAVWETARVGANELTAPVDNNPFSSTFGQSLELPAKLSLPGSNSLGTNTLTIRLFGPTNANASDSSASNAAMMDGVLGVTDRARRPLEQDIVVTRTMGNGPILTNNPIPPDLHLIANGRILDGIDSAGVTATGQGGGTLTGNLFRIAQPLDDVNTLEGIGDVAFGAFLNPAHGLGNPPRRLNHAGVLATKLQPQNINNPAIPSPGVPFPPGGTTESSHGGAMLMQPLGLRLYVVDNVRGRVQIINSNTFQPLGTLPGVSSPRGLALGGGFLYVSNFDQNSITRVGVNPLQALTFHTATGTTAVGPGPTAVSLQPGNEDVVILNSQANSISFVDVPNFQERVQLPVGLGPREVMVSNRWTGPGTTSAYQAYVTNQLSNSLTIYESDTPLITEPNGPNGKIISEFAGLVSPLYGTTNLFTGAFNGIGAQGVVVPNSGSTTCTYVGMTNYGLGPTPGLAGPPSFRTFSAVINYASNSPTGPTDCCLDAFTVATANAVRLLLASYPAAGNVAAIDFNNGAFYGAVTVPGTQIFGAFDQ